MKLRRNAQNMLVDRRLFQILDIKIVRRREYPGTNNNEVDV